MADFEPEPCDEDGGRQNNEFGNVAKNPTSERLLNTSKFFANKLRNHAKRLVEIMLTNLRQLSSDKIQSRRNAGVAQWLESEFSKLVMRVRSPSPAPIN